MDITKEWAQRYLGSKLQAPELQLIELVRFPRGSSRDTWFVTLQESPQAPQKKLVIRGDWSTGAIDGTPLIDEFKMYELLGKTEIPATHALWWEADPKWIGGQLPFYVRNYIEGHWSVPHFTDPDPRYDELRIEISREHLRKLAIVHNVDWKAVGFDAILSSPPSNERCAQHYVDWIVAEIEKLPAKYRDVEGIPILYEAVEWLYDHAPSAPRICLCKGTNGQGEEVFRGREIVAMSDWEEAHLGDPSADFAFMQDFIPEVQKNGETIWNLPLALDYYRAVSGIDVTVAAVQYYVVVRFLRLLLTTLNAAASVSQEPVAEIRKAWTAVEVMNMVKRGIAGAIGIMPPVSAERFRELNQTI